MDFKERLKQLRKMRGLSQVALADKVGISKSTIGAYETEDRKPSREALKTLSEFFGVSIDYLLGDESRSTYHMDPEFAYKAQQTYIDPRTRILLDVKQKLSDEDIEIVTNLAKALMAKGH